MLHHNVLISLSEAVMMPDGGLYNVLWSPYAAMEAEWLICKGMMISLGNVLAILPCKAAPASTEESAVYAVGAKKTP